MLPGLILIWLLLPQTARPMRRWWHLQRMPSNGPLQQLQSWRSEWRGWVTPLATDIPSATGAPPAIDVLPATGGPDPWDSRKKVPREFHMGKLRLNQEVPRWTLTKGKKVDIDFFEHQRMFQVTSCWGGTTQEQTWSPSSTRQRCWVTFAKGRAPSPGESLRHAGQGNAHMTLGQKWAISCPHHMWQTEATPQADGWLVKTKRGGSNHPSWRRCRSWVSPTTGTPPPATPGWGGALPSRHWGGRRPPSPPTSTSPPPPSPCKYPEPSTCTPWIAESGALDMYRCHLGGRSSQRSLAMQTTKNLPRRCTPPLRFLRHATGQRRWITTMHNCTGTPLHWQALLSATEGCEVQCPGHPSCPAATYHCLCKGSAALGQGGASPSPQPTSLPGEECTGTLVGNGATHHFCRGRCLCDHSAIQMDRNNLTTVNGGHPPRVPKEPHSK